MNKPKELVPHIEQNSRIVFAVNNGRIRLSMPSRNLKGNILAGRFLSHKSLLKH